MEKKEFDCNNCDVEIKGTVAELELLFSVFLAHQGSNGLYSVREIMLAKEVFNGFIHTMAYQKDDLYNEIRKYQEEIIKIIKEDNQ